MLNLADINECEEAAATAAAVAKKKSNNTADDVDGRKMLCGNDGKQCINLVGSFRCECPPGYLTDDKGHCAGK